ncbi:MAG: molybdopterin-dependent oxidoreductase [Chloroflexi bacterium]|nr:molybdopterin-dependent oxidoreductase [Chloroflexota bacterium]
MKNRFLIFIVILILTLSTACQTATATVVATIEPTAVETEAALSIFEFLASDGTSTPFTLQALQDLPTTEGQAGIKSSTGKISLPTLFKGVTLKDLVALDPKFDETMGVTLYAVDGYSITFSYDQIMNGNFVQYDPGTGDELKSPVAAVPMIAYEMDGKELDPQLDGYLRLMVASDEPKQVVDGHWSVKFINKVEVKPLSKDWSLHLEGAINELMDRATFESGSSPKCHGVTWTDESGQVWAGIPLWLLVGRVDDAVKHEGPAFNDAAADKGYQVDVVASDGYSVTFDIARIKRVDTILVAYLVDEVALPEKYFPLRLVGDGLAKNEMVGAIEKIVVHVDPIVATVVPSPEPTGEPQATTDATFNLSGLVSTPLALTDAGLHALDVVTVNIEHPKNGKMDFEGVWLSMLLEKARVTAGAKKLVLTANDGYSAEVFLTEVQACPDCLLAFSDVPGSYSLAMPGFPSNVWIKGIVSIDIQ